MTIKNLAPHPWRCRDTGPKLAIYAKGDLSPFALIDRAGPDLGMTNARTIAAAPAMLALLNEALAHHADVFKEDEPVSGADLVDWFSQWSERVEQALKGVAP